MITKKQAAALDAALKDERQGAIPSSLGSPPTIVRDVPFPGETRAEAHDRRFRERLIEAARGADSRLSGGRVHPVFYE